MHLNETQTGDILWELCTNEVIMIPNYGDYLAWNEALYQFMARDTVRKEAYEKVIKRNVKDKVIVEIGPGSKLFWTLMCVDAGAKNIYAIEENETAYQSAKKLLIQKGLGDKIELIHGLSIERELPEKADICLSELIGCIGNSEGVAHYLNDAKRFLKPQGRMIPEGCLTLLSPTYKPTEVYKDKFLDELMVSYEKAIFEKMGREFPLTRYYAYNFPQSHLIASPQFFEEMWFNDKEITEKFDKTLTFQVLEKHSFDGLLLWINLYVGSDVIIDIMNTTTHWGATYIPIAPFTVERGDLIEVHCRSEFRTNGANPDYFFKTSVKRGGKMIYNCPMESLYM